MFVESELIVYSWFLPVVLQIVLPLTMLSLWLVRKSIVLLTIKVGEKSRESRFVEKRANRRVHTGKLRAEISDSFERFTGKIHDISIKGICLIGLPEDLFGRSERLEVKVRQGENYFNIMVSPRWQKSRESGSYIGATILDVPTGWPEFVASARVV